jgi:uncharacterized spore protein YtfJ
MEIRVDELLDKVSGHVKELASTETILGDEFKIGEYTCRPVIKVGTGFGSGAGSGDEPKSKCKGSGGGAAAGISVVPLGFLASRGEELSFVAVDKKTALSSLFEKVPDLVEKVARMKNRDEEKEAKPGKEEKKEK